ncbi:MAG: tape measure protein [Muricomes sp.]
MMADGEIRIQVKVDGKDVEATIEGMNKLQGESKKAASGMKDFTASMVAVKIGAEALRILNDALSDSIKRFDTFARYPKVMESLGYSADVSGASIEKLSKGIEGLPTTLDNVVSSTQKMTTITGNLNKSTDAVLALNNSFMANGASVSDAERGMVQYLQMLSKGTVDIVSWRTLQETMGVALRKTAEEMGYFGSSGVNQLYSALQSGKTTFSDFQNHLIKIATGTGEIAQLAQENSKGIETSFTNLRTAVVRNLADLVKVFDEMSQEITGKGIADNIDSLKGVINSSFGTMKSVVRGSTPVFNTFSDVIKGTIKVANQLSPALMGVVSAYAAFKIITSINGIIVKSNALITTAKKANEGLTTITSLYTAATAKRTIAESSNVAVTKAQIAVQAAQNGTIGIGTAAIGLLTGALTTHEAVTIAATAATKALTVALGFLTSPLGIVASVVGIFVAGLALQKKQLDAATSSSNELVAATEKLIEKTSESTQQISENISARKSELDDIDNSTEAYSGLIDELDSLIDSEHKSASEKSRIQTIVDSLNNSVSGLGLAYDKENDNLSIGTDILKERVRTLQAAEKAQAAQKQVVGINKDILASESALNTYAKEKLRLEKQIADNRNVSAQEWDQNKIKILENEKSYQAALDVTNAKIAEEQERHAGLKSQAEETNAAIVNSQAIVDAAISDGVMNQAMNYAMLSDAQKEAVDSMNAKWLEYEEHTTNMFDTLSDEQTLSAQEMIDNMIENQRVMSQWADNISILADRGVNQGLLDKLRDAGPESAGYVAALVTASDEQLQQLNSVFENGGTTATDSLKKAFNFEGSGIPESITGLVTQAKESLSNQMASADFASVGTQVGTDLAQSIANNGEQVRAASETMGANIPQGAAAGVSNNNGLVTDAVTGLATTSIDIFKSLNGINSPSTVYEGFGKNIDEGTANGIGNNKELVISQLRTLAEDMKSAFKDLHSDFMQIGSYLMDGLAIGIKNNANTAVAAAQSAAARVKEATKEAYDVNSPSKWMEDFIAKYMMVGEAKGFDKYSYIPVKAMERAAEAIKLPAITAEQAIGRGFSMQMSPQSVSNNYYSKNDNSEILGAINKISNRPVVVAMDIDSREFAKVTAIPMQNRISENQKLRDMMNGVRR